MADLGELVVRLSADLKELEKGLSQGKEKVKGFGDSIGAFLSSHKVAIAATATAILAFGASSVKAYAETEQAVKRLAITVGEDAARSLSEYASELQRTTQFSDDAVLSVENQLAAFGVLPGSIKEATLATVNFAAATGKDLSEAASSVGQALTGRARDLQRYGLNLDEGANKSENLAKITSFLNDRFKDAGTTMKNTVIGSFENLINRVQDLQKKIGEELVPVFKAWVGWAEKGLEIVEKLTGAKKNDLSVSELAIVKLREERDAIIAKTKVGHGQNEMVRDLTEEERNRLNMITRQISALKEQVSSEKKVTKEIKDQEGAINDYNDAAQERINKLQEEIRNESQVQARITEIITLETDARVAKAQNAFEAQASLSQALSVKMAADTQSWGTVFSGVVISARDQFASGMAEMIVEGGKLKDFMADMGKNLLKMFIEEVIKQMVTRWIAGIASMNAASSGLSVPGMGGFGGVLGGIGVAAGIGGLMKGFSGGILGEPSMIVGLRSGARAIAGEKGPEALVSFEEDLGISPAQARNRLMGMKSGGGGGGGDVHLHIHGGEFIDGSPNKWQRLLRGVIAPEVRRLSESSPKSSFIRRRGQS